MALEPEAEEIRRLLSATSAAPTSGPDVDAITSGVRRRRRTRRGSAGLAVVLALGVGAAIVLPGDEDPTQVEVADESTPTVPEDPATTVPAPPTGDLGAIGPLAPEGIAVQTEAGVELRGLDGVLLETLDGYRLATADRPDGLRSTVTNVLPLEAADGSLHWFDPASGRAAPALGSAGGVPLWHGGRVVIDGGSVEIIDGLDGTIAGSWTTSDRWWVSSDHRVVTWEECTGSDPATCSASEFDSDTGEMSTFLWGCWIAHRTLQDAQICDEGRSVMTLGGGSTTVFTLPQETGIGENVATAAWAVGAGRTLVRMDARTCMVVDAMVGRVGRLEALLAEASGVGVPSSAPIGLAADGRAIVHLNAAACEASAAPEDLGVYLIDIASGIRTQGWAGAALPEDVRAWTLLPLAASPPEPTPPIAGPPLESLEAVVPDEIGRDVIEFGGDGIVRILDGERHEVWDQPVERAFGDFAGGVVFQDRSVVTEHPDGRVDVQRGAIRHLAYGETTPRELVSARDDPTLWMVGMTGGLELGEPLHGRSGYVWFTRSDPGGEDPADTSATLFSMWTETGDEREIGPAGSASTALDGIAHLGDGRTLFSTCHIQCAIRPGLNDPDPIVLPHWLGGLDGAPDAFAFVRFWVPDIDGRPTLPTLQVWDLNGTIRREVPLPPAIGWQTFVDLSDDGAAALVWSRDWRTGEVTGPVYVDGLDTDAPRVRAVATSGQQVRFAE